MADNAHAAAGPTGMDRRLGEPVPVGRLVARFALAGVPAVLLAIVITAWSSVRVGTRQGIEDAKRVAYASGRIVESLGLEDSLARRDPAAIAKLDAVVRSDVLRASLVRVKVWTRDGTIVYSDEGQLIGQQFVLDDESLEAFDDESNPKADVSGLDKDENVFEAGTKLLEVYQGVESRDGTRFLLETYFRYDQVAQVGQSMWRAFAPIAVGSLLLLELAQIPFAWNLARRLRAGQESRERLLQHAIESSDSERRRIAGDLHDGVVQELTGVSMSLTAAGMRGAGAGTDAEGIMSEAGNQIRESVKSLRSLLVDIYPPNLHQEGLESALADLLGALNNRGMSTALEVTVPDRDMSAQDVSLLYRSAQEALRNVAAHSRANRVSVRVARQDGYVVLVIDDDGRGFDAAELSARAQDGHVGLRSLAGLLSDAGGGLEIRSAAGKGTRIEVRLAS